MYTQPGTHILVVVNDYRKEMLGLGAKEMVSRLKPSYTSMKNIYEMITRNTHVYMCKLRVCVCFHLKF